MTRKARRKRQQHARRHHRASRTPRPGSSWFAVGAFVASAAVATPAAATVPPYDPRLAIIARVFEAHQDPVASVPHRFEIPAGPLDEVVNAFAQATGIAVSLQLDSLGSIQSPGVSGFLDAPHALEELLVGTSLRARFQSPTLVVLEIDVHSEKVEVTGHAEVVASPKYVVPVRDIPQTIEVIPRAAMEQQGVTTLSEALRNVPGITMQAGEGGGASNTAGDMFNMRGFNAANSLFVDNVRDDGLISRDVYNVEQVEVFMGPTGSDVGRGTAAGYVNMQTKAPHLPTASSGSLTFGSAHQRRVTFDVNQPLSLRQDGGWLAKSAVRVNALWQDSGVPGRDFANNASKAIAPSLALGLNTPTRVVVAGQFMRQDNVPDYGVPGSAWHEDQLAPTTVQTASPVDQTNYYGSPAYDFDHGFQNTVLARVEHDINPRISFRNQTRYNDARREAVITSIQNPAAYNPATDLVALSRQGNNRENKIFANQTTVIDRFATGRLHHAATAGLEYTFEQQFAPTIGGVGVRNPVNIYAPNPSDPVTGYAVAPTGAASKGWTNTVALYAFDAIDVAPRWQVNGGLRFDRYHTEFHAIDATGLTTTRAGASDLLTSGKVGLLFRVNGDANVYLSYGSTSTPPGAANFTLSTQVNNQNNPNVKPQVSTNLEAGAKWDAAGGRLLVTGAVFHTVNRNVIYTVDATAIPPIYNQDDGQLVDGVTVGINGRILPGWQLIANFSYLNTRQQSQNSATNGLRLVLTPEFSGGIWTTYELPHRLTVGAGLRATDQVYINTANTIVAPGYRLLDALAEYPVNTHLSLRLNVYNVTDEVYIRSVNNNGGRYNPGNPRSVLVSTAVSF
ncbi:MAG TPA: TonB-dependent siderophore receptor [Vicinamibacterales bacterium]